MSLQLATSSPELEKKPSMASFQETLASSEAESDDARPMVSLMPQVDIGGSLGDLMLPRVWRDHVMWRAGIIEGIASGTLNFLSGLLVATLSTWPRPAIPAGILFGNTILVSILISATASATGAHINSVVTIATAFSKHCHPVRAIIYVFCQVAGGVLGGILLRVALGQKFAYEIHNGGCWIEPGGEVGVWQAALIEVIAMLILLFLGYGVGLDPRQAKLFGPKYGPVLVGCVVGLMTSLTAMIHIGYTGAGLFPGRCFGLAVGIGEFQTSHWVWWIPDILAAVLYGYLYKMIPSYIKPHPRPVGAGNV